MRTRWIVGAFACAGALVLGTGCGSDDATDTTGKVLTSTTAATTTSMAEPDPTEPPTTAGGTGCTTSGTAGDWTLNSVPTDSDARGFFLQYATGEDGGWPLEFSFGTGEGGSGRPHLQVSGNEDVWIGEIPAFDPTKGVTVATSLKSDGGGAALTVNLTVTC